MELSNVNTIRIVDLRTEYLLRPLGLDITNPRFSWQLAGHDGLMQRVCRIRVGLIPGTAELWDTGRLESPASAGIRYTGAPLQAKTRYFVTVTVWDEEENEAEETDWFETGFLNPSQSAWGAEWIGAPEYRVSAKAMGVFALTSTITVAPGSGRAGIIFGAGDWRLQDPNKNQFHLSGESEIRYVLNVAAEPAVLEIYRIGYAPGDSAEKPFAVVPLTDPKDPEKKPLITAENRHTPHEIRIEVPGNCAYFYLDGVRVDEETRVRFRGPMSGLPRQLNPLGDNDITTFPRLNQVGFYVGEGDSASFSGLEIRNLRAPAAIIAKLDGMELTGEKRVLFNPSCHSLPMLRRDFTVQRGKTLSAARLYMTARGIYDCRINGQPITETRLNPGNTQYDKHIVYQTYDIASFLHEGINGIGVTLGSGWWSDAQTFVVKNYNYYGDREALLARLELRYSDGTGDVIATGSDWAYYGEGPYTYAGLFQGEHLDRRSMETYERFSEPGFAAVELGKAAVIHADTIDGYSDMPPGFGKAWPKLDHTYTKLVGNYDAPVREVCRRKAVSMTQPRPGVFLYDLGQEMAGVPCILLKGKAGTEVVIRYGEMLYPDLPEYEGQIGMMLTENYRDAESIDHVILRGDAEGERFEPKFTFHGYRYIEITGVENPPAIEDVESIQISSVPKLTGEIVTSNPLVNRFIENVRWSQLCNFISVPTDCPQRNERMGWAGDTHVFCRTATYQADTRLFYYRYLEALRDLQEESGSLPAIAPMGGGFGGITYETAMIFIVWELYQQYADREVVEEYYDAMCRWMEFAHQNGMPGDGFAMSLADWLAPVETDGPLLFNAFYFRACFLMEKMAALIGREADAAVFAERASSAKEYWNTRFVDSATGKTACDTQTSYALPIMYGVLNDRNREAAFAHLDRKTREVGCTVSTGFFGTGQLNPALSAGGHTDTACQTLLQTRYPSWLYPVTQGATTIWERWNSYTVDNGFGGNNSMNSFNHYSLGSVLAWIYETLLGIRRNEEHPGYRRFTLAPAFEGFDFVHGGIDTPYGRIESGWEKKDGFVSYTCTVPANTEAELVLPDGTREYLRSGSFSFAVRS